MGIMVYSFIMGIAGFISSTVGRDEGGLRSVDLCFKAWVKGVSVFL